MNGKNPVQRLSDHSPQALGGSKLSHPYIVGSHGLALELSRSIEARCPARSAARTTAPDEHRGSVSLRAHSLASWTMSDNLISSTVLTLGLLGFYKVN